MMTRAKCFFGLIFFTLCYAFLIGGYGAFLAIGGQQLQFNAGLLFVSFFFPWAIIFGLIAFFCFLRLTKIERAKPALLPRVLMFFSLLPGLILLSAFLFERAQ